jgi:catechol 2,3-dioxygenase-like lactoylglutathione lyase family enzyme
MSELSPRVIPSLLARDLDETLRFYQEVLGFEITGLHPQDAEPFWAEVTRDGASIHFYNDPPVGTPDRPVMSGTLYFHPSDVLELAAEIEDKVDFAWGPEGMDYGMREFAVRDPNGYLIAFWEPA